MEFATSVNVGFGPSGVVHASPDSGLGRCVATAK